MKKETDVKNSNAYVFMKKGCPWCEKAQELLVRNGYNVYMLDHRIPKNMDTLLRHLPREKSRKMLTWPQIFIGDEYIDGYDMLEKKLFQ